MKRAVYDNQFKMAALKMAQLGDKSVLETAKELGISASSLRRWVNEYDEYGESAFPGLGNALFNSTHEIKKLQKQNEELKLENDLLKTSVLLEAKECVRFQLLKENQKKYNIKKACQILKISRSGYYNYLHRHKSKKSIENEALSDIFKENEGRYGSRRIQKVLLQRNIKVNEKWVSRIMSQQGLIAKGRKTIPILSEPQSISRTGKYFAIDI